MFFFVCSVTELPEIRIGKSTKNGFFIDIYPVPTDDDAHMRVNKIVMPEGFTIDSMSTVGEKITILCQAPSPINTVNDLGAAEGKVVITFCV